MSGFSSVSIWFASQQIDPRLDPFPRAAGQRIVGEQDQPRLQRGLALGDAGDDAATPAERAVGGEHEVAVGRRRHLLGALGDFAGERLRAAARSALTSVPSAQASASKRNPASRPTCCPSTRTSPAGVISASSIAFSFRRRMSTLVRRSTNRAVSRSCSASDRRSSIARVAFLPMQRVVEPVRPVGDEGPGADMGDAVGERVDVALGAVGIGDLPVEPVVGDDVRRGPGS